MSTLTIEKFNTNYILNYLAFWLVTLGVCVFICNSFIMKFKMIFKVRQKHKRGESYSIKLIRLKVVMGRQEATQLSDFYAEQLSGRW